MSNKQIWVINKVKGYTREEWMNSYNTEAHILKHREIGLETDTQKFKFGNNEHTWSQLPYAGGTLGKYSTEAPDETDTGYDVGQIWVHDDGTRKTYIKDNERDVSPASWKLVSYVEDLTDGANAGQVLSFDGNETEWIYFEEKLGTPQDANNLSIAANFSNTIFINNSDDITSLGGVTEEQKGIKRTLIFNGNPILKHVAEGGNQIILPNGKDISVKSGDAATFVATGVNKWTCISYIRAFDSAVVSDSIVLRDDHADIYAHEFHGDAMKLSEETQIGGAEERTVKEVFAGTDYETDTEPETPYIKPEQIVLRAMQDAYGKTIHKAYVQNNKLGQPGGVAQLDSSGFVPPHQLPSYVDDVLLAQIVEFTITEEVEIVPEKEALENDWLDVTPTDGLYYKIISPGSYYNFIVKFKNAEEGYELITETTSWLNILNPFYDENAEEGTIGYEQYLEPETGKIYMIITGGYYANRTYRYNKEGYFVHIKGDLVIGDVLGTAFDGSRGKELEEFRTNLGQEDQADLVHTNKIFNSEQTYLVLDGNVW